METTRLAIVCGLAAEARIAAPRQAIDAWASGSASEDAVAIVVGGGDAGRIRAALDRLRPTSVLSFGIAGGLDPALVSGSVCVATAVQAPDGRTFETEATWSRAMVAALDAPVARFAGVDRPLADADAKLGLHTTSGAATVDMESHHAGAWAHDHGAEFAALRVVTDPARRSLPHAATVGMRADGSVDIVAILASLARNPGQIPALVRTGLEARRAFAALLRCRQRLGAGFARLDL